MCGIIGYVGYRDARPILLAGLRRLECRGYDSAGVAVLEDGQIVVRKAAGKLARLAELTQRAPVHGQVGIGHTRWATHGVPTDENAHPHTDCTGDIVVIHNGIIENFLPLRERLQDHGHHFRSDTDTEVIAHLIEEAYARLPETPERMETAVGQATAQTPGATAILTPERVTIPDLSGTPRHRPVQHITWDAEMAEKGGYPHFMLKEIHEQPRALSDTIMGRLDVEGRVELEGVQAPAEFVTALDKVWMTACGTAYHAALVGRWLIEHLARIPAEVDLASEFRYRDSLVAGATWGIAISQSGENADTPAGAPG